eukprot:m.275288 g.275288  ORF g.275288 m.275288 type:complete len:50 (+) comp17692_c0_seq54:2537-2686(+)
MSLGLRHTRSIGWMANGYDRTVGMIVKDVAGPVRRAYQEGQTTFAIRIG